MQQEIRTLLGIVTHHVRGVVLIVPGIAQIDLCLVLETTRYVRTDTVIVGCVGISGRVQRITTAIGIRRYIILVGVDPAINIKPVFHQYRIGVAVQPRRELITITYTATIAAQIFQPAVGQRIELDRTADVQVRVSPVCADRTGRRHLANPLILGVVGGQADVVSVYETRRNTRTGIPLRRLRRQRHASHSSSHRA